MVAGKEADSRLAGKKGSPRSDHEKETSNNITYERLNKQMAWLKDNTARLHERMMSCEKRLTIIDGTLEELESVVKKW